MMSSPNPAAAPPRIQRYARTVSTRARGLAHTDSYRFALALVMVLFIVTVDVTNYLDTGTAFRYLILIVPLSAIILIRLQRPSSRLRRPTASDVVLLVTMIFGLIGSVFGRVYLGTGSTALPIFVPMGMAFLYRATVDVPTDSEVRKLIVLLASIGLLYVALNALANSGLAPTLQNSRSYRNAKFLYVALGFGAVLMNRRRWQILIFSAMTLYVFKTYPSATSALVAMTTIVTLFVTRREGSHARVWVVAMVVMAGIILALFNFARTVQLADDYFNTVGKRNNTNTRLALWKAGIKKFESSPLIGDAFSGETTVSVTRRVGGGAPFKNPYNNDYILFAASGGVVGLTLLLLWIFLTEREALRRYRGYRATGQYHHAALLRVLLVGFNAWLTAAAFNPLFQGMARSVTLFAIYGLMMLLGSPQTPLQAPPADLPAGADA